MNSALETYEEQGSDLINALLYDDRLTLLAIKKSFYEQEDASEKDFKRLLKNARKTIKLIDKAFVKRSQYIKEPIIVYRGVSGHLSRNLNVKIGHVITYRGFVSTTPDIDIARRYLGKHEYKKYILCIILPNNTPIINLKYNEILLNRDSKFKILMKNGEYIILLNVN